MQKPFLSPDIAFLVGRGFPAERLIRLAQQAQDERVHPHQYLIANGLIGEDAYYRALAAMMGVRFITNPLDEVRFPEEMSIAETGLASRAGIAQVREANDLARLFYLNAPYGRDVALLLARVRERPSLKNQLALCTPAAFRNAFIQQGAASLLVHSVEVFHTSRPRDSARRSFKPFFVLFALILSSIGFAVLQETKTYAPLIGMVFGVLYLSACFYRIQAYADFFENTPKPLPLLAAGDLPFCSVLVPLYREARMVPQLVAALDAIDYPRARLDVLFLVEADDAATARALQNANLAPHCRVLVVPPGLPRTKPRAMQVGLNFARGEIITIFDAEDIPHPQQLRKAATLLEAGGPQLACLQAELRIDNAERSWLSKQFALEYAALFKVFLPSLTRRHLPALLGGTSNYFRSSVLRAVGGWDPWNVTEDADLGVRLARAGYRIGTIDLPTEEEAPVTLANWLQQRLRWQKGWMQTLTVHFSQPRNLLRELGVMKSWALIATLGVSLLSAFAYPVFIVMFATDMLLDFDVLGRDFLGASVFGMSLAAFVGGHVFPLMHIHAGAKRAGQTLSVFSFLTFWAYWLLVSVAAYAALFQLLTAPHAWCKTEHLGRQAGINPLHFLRLRRVPTQMATAKRSAFAKAKRRPADRAEQQA